PTHARGCPWSHEGPAAYHGWRQAHTIREFLAHKERRGARGTRVDNDGHEIQFAGRPWQHPRPGRGRGRAVLTQIRGSHGRHRPNVARRRLIEQRFDSRAQSIFSAESSETQAISTLDL